MDELLKLSHEVLIEKSNEASKNGDIEFFEKIISLGLKDKILNSTQMSNTPYSLFDNACSNNQIGMVKYFINSSYWSNDFNNYFIISENAREVCHVGSLELIEYFFNEPKIKDKNNLYSFILDAATCYGRLDIVEYILENFSNNAAIYISIINGQMLNNACSYGHLDIIKYFFNSEASNNSHRDILKEDLFKMAINNNNTEVLQYLIMDLNIKKNKVVKDTLKKTSNPEIERMFHVRDLNQSLQGELEHKGLITKKPKI